ncbi:MAG: hypothetical protein PHV28_08265 [Kiritimatiellae bacterium]|nr:hypothetical protein [Kiritimatiellia bacterium]
MKAARWVKRVVGIVMLGLGFGEGRADTLTWTAGTNDWHAVQNWTNWAEPAATRVPADGDIAVITNAGGRALLTQSSAYLGALVISNAAVSCSNWVTTLYTTNLTILKDGFLTCEGPFTNNVMSNRVCVTCSTLTIERDGAIDVQGKGWSGGFKTLGTGVGNGPGGGAYMCGASYGGVGTMGQYNYRLTNVYGTATAPLDPGSGGAGYSGTWGGHGGGAVRVVATQVVVNGRMNANGSKAVGGAHSSGGSGGSIFITCNTLTGTNGLITANAGLSYGGGTGGGSGGGRIAVDYNPAAQSGLPSQPFIQFQTGSCLSENKLTVGDIGTLYFPDSTLFSPANLFTGQWVGPAPIGALTLSDWTISNVWLRLPGFDVTVTNTLTVTGTNALLNRLEFTNGMTIACSNLIVSGGSFGVGGMGNPSESVPVFSPVTCGKTGPTITCSGNLILTNAARFYVYAGLTNSGAESGYGARVNVGGDLRVTTSNCWIYPVAHPTNGSVVLFSAGAATIGVNSGFNANQLGYSGGQSASSIYPFGTGIGTVYSGAGHGGQGGTGSSVSGVAGKIYDDPNAPIEPGSGARYGTDGTTTLPKNTSGGGSIQLRVAGTLAVQGILSANGDKPGGPFYGGSSGGSIYLTCRTFIGASTALLQANGGNGHWYGDAPVATGGGGGGGGLIAVWRVYDLSTGAVSNSAAGGLGYNAVYAGSSIPVWGWLPTAGTLFSLQ